ncbi:MAG TPA: methionine--tRNA ligase subunit beta, partial [Pyrinomonadaceae bacterium]
AAKRVGVDSDAMELASSLELARDQFVRHMDEFAFNRALETAWGIIARVDKFITDAKPWVLAKSEEHRETLGAVLYRSAETIRWLAALLYPFMPEASGAIARQLGIEDTLSDVDPSGLKWGDLKPGTKVGEVSPIFPRIDKAKTMAEIEKTTASEREGDPQAAEQAGAKAAEQTGAHATQAAVPGAETATGTKPTVPPMKGATEADAVPAQTKEAGATKDESAGVTTLIGIEDFVKVELRAAQVLTAERVPKADKLLKLTVDLGEAQPRQILAGIAQYYEPEKLVGRKIVVVANLQPRKMRGLESNGMLLAASVGDEGRPVLATFTEDVPNGARLK